ncbi:MAG: hypothetical protein PHY47_23330 [Lachnospiraceae bacterium]|nr:hypothetical protein [Lachnospiraceae bacterium]
MSQPVKYHTNIEYGIRMKEKYNSEFFAFAGYNQMTDGLIVLGEGDLLEPYEGSESRCAKQVDYMILKEQVLEADSKGMRFTIHSEGDGAFRKILDIFEECEKTEDGKLKNSRCQSIYPIKLDLRKTKTKTSRRPKKKQHRRSCESCLV